MISREIYDGQICTGAGFTQVSSPSNHHHSFTVSQSSDIAPFGYVSPDQSVKLHLDGNCKTSTVSRDKNIVTCGPISRQRPKYAHATIEKVLQEMFSMLSAPYPLLGNGSLNTFLQKLTMKQ
jgi:hypothetical protein